MTPANHRFLPYGRQQIDDDDIAAVVSVLKGDWLTTGPAVGAFERAFADFVGARYAVACSSGTAGLHLAAIALGLGFDASQVVDEFGRIDDLVRAHGGNNLLEVRRGHAQV